MIGITGLVVSAIAGASFAASHATSSGAPMSETRQVKNIVLVHGAFADGSSWSKLIPVLQAKGYHVTAVQNPVTSLADDVAMTKRTIALQDGPVILVGHSWGGAVITQAGDDPKVVGLVYVAAYAPSEGESANDASNPFGRTPGQQQIRVDESRFAYLTDEGFLENIAEGLPMEERRILLAAQGLDYGPAFDDRLAVAAWKTKPTWCIIASKDRMLPPEMEIAAAKRMKANTTILHTCHMAMLEQPEKVAEVIVAAATRALAQQ
jgi:pimeloyl-ACP methyl ester carboxylesterase